MLWVIGALLLGGVGYGAYRYFGNADGSVSDTSTPLLSDSGTADPDSSSTTGSGDTSSSDSGGGDSGGGGDGGE
jgi:hypothetical protein